VSVGIEHIEDIIADFDEALIGCAVVKLRFAAQEVKVGINRETKHEMLVTGDVNIYAYVTCGRIHQYY
jgi:hypothetical protein